MAIGINLGGDDEGPQEGIGISSSFREGCDHAYGEVSSATDMEGETYECRRCGHRYRLYYDDMK